ncbi:hypothetical protein CBS101457_002623 [Exobasidium rhododendri]|nr:hypothetical protein CBS101457_002623 [Exobasidium rhododendri]
MPSASDLHHSQQIADTTKNINYVPSALEHQLYQEQVERTHQANVRAMQEFDAFLSGDVRHLYKQPAINFHGHVIPEQTPVVWDHRRDQMLGGNTPHQSGSFTHLRQSFHHVNLQQDSLLFPQPFSHAGQSYAAPIFVPDEPLEDTIKARREKEKYKRKGKQVGGSRSRGIFDEEHLKFADHRASRGLQQGKLSFGKSVSDQRPRNDREDHAHEYEQYSPQLIEHNDHPGAQYGQDVLFMGSRYDYTGPESSGH